MISGTKFNFQYCPKIVIFNEKEEVLLCRRVGEQDFDGIFSFPGGKREISDESIEIGITREIQEELGSNLSLDMYRLFCIEREYRKIIGDTMILPHYMATYKTGMIHINPGEYSEYRWVSLDSLDTIQTISTVSEIIDLFTQFRQSNFFAETQQHIQLICTKN